MPFQETKTPQPPAIKVSSSNVSHSERPIASPSTPRSPLRSTSSSSGEQGESKGTPASRKHKGSHNHVRINDDPEITINNGDEGPSGSGHQKRASFAFTVDDDAGRHDAENKGSGDDEQINEKTRSEKLRILAGLRLKKILGHRWFCWIGPKLTWGKLKPVIRCAIAAWLGLVLLVIVPVEAAMGNGAFFLLIVSFMLPPSDPVVQTLEKYLYLFVFTALSWVWVIIAVLIAGATRVPPDPNRVAAAEAKWAYLKDINPAKYQQRIIFDGTYLQAKPAVVCSIFLSAGTGALLCWKMKTQPSPATFPFVLSCILMDVSLTTVVFFPYNFYTSGLLFFLPMAIQVGIGTLCSFFIFPESVGHSFQSKFPGILTPLASAMRSIEALFGEAEKPDNGQEENTDDLLSVRNSEYEPKFYADKLDDWAERSKKIRAQLLQSLAGLPPLRAQQRYLAVDVSYSRLSGEDLRNLFDRLAIVQARSGGMAFFFDVIVTNAKHSHLDSSAWSVHQVSQSRPGSRAASIRHEFLDEGRGSVDDSFHADGTVTPPPEVDNHAESPHHDRGLYFGSRKFNISGILRRSNSPHGFTATQKGSHLSLLDHLRKSQQPVGVYESTRYMDIERNFAVDTEHVLEQLDILARGSAPVIRACEAALSEATDWILNVNRDRKIFPWPIQHRKARKEKERDEKDVAITRLEEVTGHLQSALDDFCVTRLEIIQPYKHLFDPTHPEDGGHRGKMHFRSLFQNFVAQYHVIEFAEALLKLLRLMEELDKSRQKRRLWYPHLSTMVDHFRHSHKDKHLTGGDDGHENEVAFEQEEEEDFLGEAKKRNPEYKPFDNPLLNLIAKCSGALDILSSRSFMYALKAAVLGALTTLPNFIAAQLSRVVASFWGCLIGMVLWYIGSGSGQGNPYGIAAVCAVAFPLASFFRIHFPGPLLTAVMTPVTMGLVIGYSYYNGTIGPLTNAEWGWDVAWRRYVCVFIGISAAWAFSYVPPVYSAKRAIRYSYARTIGVAGSIFCEVLSHANDHHHHLKENDAIRHNLITWKSKLNKLGKRHINATREFSLRGQWPEERYKALFETLQDVFSLLSQLNHVLTQLERPWRKALLDRTRLSDPIFLGDVMVVLSMCSTALRAGTPLPQITPSPLVARFRMGKTKGLDLPQDPTDQSGELPSLVTVDVLESDNYMRYALGITTTFSLISRLDRIVVICKTLLGENYHISGLHLEQTTRA
ncbi:hypothetical protein I307_04809 [Cryptococcus deuterogattii 99/473]|uniref:ER transporter 6TM N-terminal domain-containing protein n=1 Tax=Cryptococcus deuterogattii Ram5 TaxID=1296110 RepID=A0A0D0UXT8_9TREE|nr:hypothetical protein I313_04012 [Cryptococcus deuterogattii Ram5]KIY55870.1 hypothetical protein I307_04809 [Cryptococcus deuterogattii 99/473]